MTSGGPSHKIIIRIDSMLAGLIPEYLDHRREDIEIIRTAIRQNDFETIRTRGHRMKGSGGGYGFDAITRIGGSLEVAAKNENPEEVHKYCSELEDFVQRVTVVYE